MRHFPSAALIAICCAAGPAVGQDDQVAILKTLSGTVTVVRNGGNLSATKGMALLKSDKLISDAGASGGIVFADGTMFTAGPSSVIEIRNYVFEPRESRYAFSVYLARGTAIYSSGKIGRLAPQSVEVNTPRATVGVRGTRFIVTAD